MITTYAANENCFLIDGEVYLMNQNLLIPDWYFDGDLLRRNVVDDKGYWKLRPTYKRITHTTNKNLDNVVLLPRDKFVKPVDVKNLADDILVPDYFDKVKEVSSTEWDIYQEYKGLIKAGYNANPNKFTIDHLKTAWAYGVEASGTFQDLIKIIIPLSLPERLEINEQGEIVNVIWR